METAQQQFRLVITGQFDGLNADRQHEDHQPFRIERDLQLEPGASLAEVGVSLNVIAVQELESRRSTGHRVSRAEIHTPDGQLYSYADTWSRGTFVEPKILTAEEAADMHQQLAAAELKGALAERQFKVQTASLAYREAEQLANKLEMSETLAGLQNIVVLADKAADVSIHVRNLSRHGVESLEAEGWKPWRVTSNGTGYQAMHDVELRVRLDGQSDNRAIGYKASALSRVLSSRFGMRAEELARAEKAGERRVVENAGQYCDKAARMCGATALDAGQASMEPTMEHVAAEPRRRAGRSV